MGKIDNTNSKMESWGVRKLKTVQTVLKKWKMVWENILEKRDKIVKLWKKVWQKMKKFQNIVGNVFYQRKGKNGENSEK